MWVEPIRLKVSDISIIVGQRGSGKTQLAKHLAKQYLSKSIDIWIYDVNNEYLDLEIRYTISSVHRYIPKDVGDIEEFEDFIWKAWRHKRIVVLIEEADLYANPHSIPRAFKNLVARGRHRKIGMILITRRIASMHKYPCSQAKHFFIFRTILPNDIKYLKEFIGDKAEELPNLPDYHFLYWSHGKAKIYSPIPING